MSGAIVKSGELFSFVTSGSRGWAKYYSESGPAFLRVGNLDHDSTSLDLTEIQRVQPPEGSEGRRTRVQANDILISVTADVGMVGLVPEQFEEAYINQHVALARPVPTVHAAYLAWCLSSPAAQKQFRELQRGATKVGLGLDDIRAIDVRLPLLPEQRRVVAEIEKQFTRLEAGVAALRRVQANLKRYRAAVLKAACEGQLVATEAELQKSAGKNKKGFESGEQLLKRILAERRQHWTGRGQYKEPAAPDTANLPPLPAGWTWAGTEELTAGIDNAITIGPFGSNLMVKDYLESGVSLIFVREIRSENFRRADTRYVSPEKAKELATHKVRGGDFVITKMGEPPGDTSIYPEGLPDAIATSDCIKLTPNRAGTTAAFLKYVIRGQPVKTQIERITRGVAQKKMSLGRFRTVAIPLPPLAEQTRIVTEVERRLSVVEELETVVSANLQRATRLRQSILQKAFTGELCD